MPVEKHRLTEMRCLFWLFEKNFRCKNDRHKLGILLFFYTGEQHAIGTTEKRKVLHSNIIAGIAVTTATIYAFFYLLSGTNNIVFSNSASIQLTFIPFFFTTFFSIITAG
ncbi:MAG: hypothetical protein ACI92E_000222 [Oceanicoccus sp.]|jgi:hypothetical protein